MDPQWHSWGTNEEMLALVAELLDLGNRLYVQAHSKPGARQPDPLEIPRPYERSEPKRRRRATADEVIAMFGERKVKP